MNCKVCLKESTYIFEAEILHNYKVKYYHCSHCGFLQTEEPYWLTEAYHSPITISDTGIINRNLALSKITAVIIYFYFNKDKTCLDFAAGYGLLVRMLRDIGLDFTWQDVHTTNIFAKGFEYSKSNNEIELITCY